MNGRETPRPIDAALDYARRGWAVFPCHAPVAGGCSCGLPGCASPGKHPRVARGLHEATTDVVTIHGWWQRWPRANVAIRTGLGSGLVVIDVDPPHGGADSLAVLTAAHGPLPSEIAVRTGSGGAHLYLAHPGGQVRNSAGTRLGAGIDVRGDGGYVIAPPSVHANGDRYSWSSLVAEAPPPVPDWLVEHLRPPAPRSTPAPDLRFDPATATAWARRALEREVEFVRSAPLGQRNMTLNRAAFSLGQIVAGGGLNGAEVEALLPGSATQVGLDEREARRTITSGMTAGARQPRLPATHWDGRSPTQLAAPLPRDSGCGPTCDIEPEPVEVEL
jgi:hypothetical protein